MEGTELEPGGTWSSEREEAGKGRGPSIHSCGHQRACEGITTLCHLHLVSILLSSRTAAVQTNEEEEGSGPLHWAQSHILVP